MILVYTAKMLAPEQDISPGAAKSEAVLRARPASIPELRLVEPKPVGRVERARAHLERHVDAVLTLRVPNGFGNRCPHVTASLGLTNGAVLEAARIALQNRAEVAAPCSGFHQTGWSFGHGSCTFNGLMVTALALQAEASPIRIGILDYDYHPGDVTEDILEALRPPNFVHITDSAVWNKPAQAEAFLANIERALDQLGDCTLLLYEAGDSHVDDPLGGFLSTQQLAQRDRAVFSSPSQRRIPVAWNLARGYQRPLQKVVDLHVNSMRACLENARP